MEKTLDTLPTAEERLRAFLYALAAADDRAREGAWHLDGLCRPRMRRRATPRNEHSANWDYVEKTLLQLLRQAHPDKNLTPDDAAHILAVADGIAVARAAENPRRMTEKRALSILNAALAAVTGRGVMREELGQGSVIAPMTSGNHVPCWAVWTNRYNQTCPARPRNTCTLHSTSYYRLTKYAC